MTLRSGPLAATVASTWWVEDDLATVMTGLTKELPFSETQSISAQNRACGVKDVPLLEDVPYFLRRNPYIASLRNSPPVGGMRDRGW